MAEPPGPRAGGQEAESNIVPLVLGYLEPRLGPPHSEAACRPLPPGGSRELSRTGTSGQKEQVPAELRTNLLTLTSNRLLCGWVCNGEEATLSLKTRRPSDLPWMQQEVPVSVTARTQVSEVSDGPGHAPGLGWQPLGVGRDWGWWASHTLHGEHMPSPCCHSCGPRPPAQGPAGGPASGPLPLGSGPRTCGGRLGRPAPGIRPQPHLQAVGCRELIPLAPFGVAHTRLTDPKPGLE